MIPIQKIKIYSLSAVSGLILPFCFPPYSKGEWIWAAMVPLLVALHKTQSAKESAIASGLAGLIFYAFGLHWFVKIFGLLSVSLFCLLALVWSLFGFFYFYLTTRQKLMWGSFLWVGLEYFRSEIWYFEFPWLSLGLSHHSSFFSSALPLASVWGVYGNSLIIFLTNQLISQFILTTQRNSRIVFMTLALFIPLALVPFLSVWADRISSAFSTVQTTKVLLVQSERYDLDHLVQMTLQSNFKGGLVVWPEYQVPILPGRRPKEENYGKMSELAKRTDSVLVAGCVEFLGAQKESKKEKIHNYVVIFDSEGKIAGTYTKRHLIPIMEKFFLLRGKSSEPIQTSVGRVGVAVCYDMDFSETLVKLGRSGAEIIVVPSLDPERWGLSEHLQHASIAKVRAVESGKWLLRACSSGPSQIVNPKGIEVSKTQFGNETVLEGKAEFSRGQSVYHKWGWIFPWICFGVSCMIIIQRSARCFQTLPRSNSGIDSISIL